MNTKPILFVSCVAAMTLSASVAIAGSHGGSAGGGFSGGGSRSGGGFRGGAAPGRMTPGFARAGSRFGPGMSRNFRGDRDRFHDRRFNEFVFFGDFGDPFFYPYYYGYYPYGFYPYGPGYGYDPYGYGHGYGYDPYNQSGYQGVAAGTGSVREMQVRLARAGYYHGRIDGVMGPRTRYAIRAYKRSHNLRVTER
jgi:hypothetical protein